MPVELLTILSHGVHEYVDMTCLLLLQEQLISYRYKFAPFDISNDFPIRN